MTKKKEQEVDHIDSGGEFFRLTEEDQSLMAQGATINLNFECCDCSLEHYVVVENVGGDIVARAFRDDAATAKNRKKK